MNGTIILICDAAFNKLSEPINVELALGLGLGLGIPVLLVTLYIAMRCYYVDPRFSNILKEQKTMQIKPYIPSVMKANEVLSKDAYTDFSTDNLSERLKRELMILRIREGKDLNDLVKEAVQGNSLTVARWIGHLYPGDIPLEIRQAALVKQEKPINIDV